MLKALAPDPFKVIKTGPGQAIEGDPLKPLEAELSKYRYAQIPQVQTFTGMSSVILQQPYLVLYLSL